MAKRCYAEDKADCVDDVALARTIQTGYAIKLGVEAVKDCAGGVRLETFKNYFNYKHLLILMTRLFLKLYNLN